MAKNQRYERGEEDASGASGAGEGAGDDADHGVDETTDDGRAGDSAAVLTALGAAAAGSAPTLASGILARVSPPTAVATSRLRRTMSCRHGRYLLFALTDYTTPPIASGSRARLPFRTARSDLVQTGAPRERRNTSTCGAMPFIAPLMMPTTETTRPPGILGMRILSF